MDKQLLIFYGIPALGGVLALLFFFLSIRALMTADQFERAPVAVKLAN